MSVLDQIYEKAKRNPQRIVFPEAFNEKMMQTAYETSREGYIIPVLVGYGGEIRIVLSEKRYEESIFTIVDIKEGTYKKSLIDRYVDLSQVTLKEKAPSRQMQNLLYHAMVIRAVNGADVTFVRINSTTGDALLAGQMVTDLKPGTGAISSIGLRNIPGFKGNEGSLPAVGDSAVCANPDTGQLASIMISACDTVSSLLDWEPRCAIVSYSTLGSGQGELVDRVAKAVTVANGQRPDFAVGGEFQFDAVVSPQVALKKVSKESRVAGETNVTIRSDLNAGDVGMKLIQQFGHANTYGFMLRGFNKVICDCSRGAPVSGIKGNIVVSTVRAAGSKR